MSSALHAYAALEAVANMFKVDFYDNVKSKQYVAIDPSDVALSELLADRNWRWLAIEKKVTFLVRARGGSLKAGLENHIGEVRELRHMLAHGVTTPASIEWSTPPVDPLTPAPPRVTAEFSTKKFPRLKFSPVDKLMANDARKVLGVVLEAIEAMRSVTPFLLGCTCYELEPQAFTLYNRPVADMLADIDAACRAKKKGRQPGA